MPTVIRKSRETLIEFRRDLLRTLNWQVGSNIWSPPTDEYETEAEYIIRMEIAGMREEDFEVSLENDTLLIMGVRPDSSERRSYHQMEIRFGKFATAVGLPGPVNMDEARAEYKDGFLTITLPKAKPNQIKVE
ncbi:MAG: Hsp20/alpha crystallin family protein [Anaerolineales bacterium]|nr:MAG: Hsp20/alpha crystallin family protein [Anaerolineales bacterium]